MRVIPPALITAGCTLMTLPVLQKLRELDVPRSQLIIDAFLGRLWLALPAVLVWTGFQAAHGNSDQRQLGAMLIPGGMLVMFLFMIIWLRRRVQNTFTPHALTVGDLRDRTFALAAKAGVKLNQILVPRFFNG